MMQQHQEGISTTGTSSTKQAGAARGSRVMDNRLRPWALYDLSGAPTADTLDTMKDHFRRFRGLRQKGVEGTAGCRSRGVLSSGAGTRRSKKTRASWGSWCIARRS
ncbi:hypothetical protein PC129_g21427 [Phytophthora cactorum]|uniref:Uncharacterized protein n=1 Tax=Phytophthora cactorum TaxID=29920 RepID=A0A8T0ZC55_9STRA|nr:hypothetical protein Pcac1_g25679 [Phytophthora cactorum]KAG2860290.1 hypothetical protein PC113_g8178 [Phytophthora cactorum]KAG2875710.1 hypothetical protein PC114_g24575 [Phytophthora cactorum]KAG2882820.1 hypothetical protein PC115_g21845 [Phytophthora cactorum]KAG2931493.1 hypothetical protein PC117_g13443 [Phytophthora cactorum]